MGIFDYLDVKGYYNVAELNPHFRDLIVEHYLIGEQHYNDREIIITVNEWCTMSANMQYFADGCKETLLVLRLFGEIFSNLKIKFSEFGNINSQQIIQHIQQYCANAEVTVVIERISESGLNDWHFTLEKAIDVNIEAVKDVDQIRLNEYFPLMVKLTLNCHDQKPLIGHYFPQLTNANIFNADFSSSDSNLLTFIRLNHQIRHFVTPFYNNNHSYLQHINEMLPELETISIRDISDIASNNLAREIIRFENVTSYTFCMSRSIDQNVDIRGKLPLIEFAKLESVTFSSRLYSPSQNDYLIDVITQHSSLQRIHLALIDWSYSQFSYLTQSLPELKEMVLGFSESTTTNEFIRFLSGDNNNQLEKITVTFYKKINPGELTARIPANWVADDIIFNRFSDTVIFRKSSA